MRSRLVEESPVHTAANSNKADRPIPPLALPFVGLGMGALLAAVYGALVAVVHLVVSGHLERTPVFAAGCVSVSAGLGLAIGTWLAIYRMWHSPPDGHQPSDTQSEIERRAISAALHSKHTSPSLGLRHDARREQPADRLQGERKR
jgi:hypothetical protein